MRLVPAKLQRGLASLVQKAGLAPMLGSGVSQWLYGATVGLPHEPFAGAWQEASRSARSAGPNILAYSAVYSCVNIISSDIARMPMRVLRPGSKGGREVHSAHPIHRLLQKPNEYQTPLQFIQQYLSSKLINGNTYVLLLRDARGVVYRMYVLDPARVRPLLADDGSIFYELASDKIAGVTQQITVPARAILHDRAATFWHPLVGVSPLFAAGVSAMTGARILMNSEKFFANMSRPGGALVAPGKIDKDVAKRLQEEWDSNYNGVGFGKTAVLSNGLEFKPNIVNAVDAELVNQLRWTVEDIARVYRVPGFKLGDLNKVSYRNSEQMSRDYFQGCLSYHIEAMEQCLEMALELDPGYDIEFDLRSLFRMETDTRYETYGKALSAGFMSINEVRAEEDLPPVKGGEEPRVQVQYVPLSKADGTGVSNPLGGTPSPAPAPASDDDEDPAPEPSPPETQSTDDSEAFVAMITRDFIKKLRHSNGDTNAG